MAVGFDVDGAAAHIVLDDPDRRNVLSPAMVQGIADAYATAERHAAVRCVVLSARGSVFCAGAELSVLEAAANGDFAGVEEVYRGFLRVARSPLPSIAVVDGPAVGAGFNLALACDLRVASGKAVFDTRFAQLGLLPGGGHTWLLEQAVGRQAATALTLFGEKPDAQAAERIGLVWRAVPTPAAALAMAGELAGRLARHERDFVTALAGALRDCGQLASHELAVTSERYAQRWSVTRPAFLDRVRALRAKVERKSI